VLRGEKPSDTTTAERDFDRLQRLVKAPPVYPYDSHSTWERGLRRARGLIALTGQRAGLRSLDVGCGDGMTAVLLAGYGFEAHLMDLEDWRDERARHLPFHQGELESGLGLPDGHFDLVYSYNTFEHLRDPAACLRELVRVCRPGGWLHLDFGPLFASAWGLHVYHTIRVPYAQFLFSEPFIERKLRELGIWDLGKARHTPQPLNRWRLAQFDELFATSGCAVAERSTLLLCRWLGLIRRYPASFSGRGLSFADVTQATIRVTLRKPAPPAKG
jgi:SAM-dependent methyltransferase